jgi:hypothetical protein
MDTDSGESLDGRGHEALAAGFVDGRTVGIGDDDGESTACRCNGCREAGGAGTGDEEIRIVEQAWPFVVQCSGVSKTLRGLTKSPLKQH